MISEIENLPDVSFIDNVTLDEIQEQMISDYQERYAQLTGSTVALKRADPVTLILYACSIQIYQALLFVDRAGKQDLLKYSYGEYLDNLGIYKGVTRNEACAAVVTVRFTLSAEQSSAVSIPAGTRVTDGSGLYFATDEYAEIAAGDLTVDVACTCLSTGAEGNGILAGEINILVDPIAYVDSVVSIEETNGGADEEDDDSFAERIYLAPSAYSTAGPVDAYIYHAKSCSTSIGDVNVTSPSECEVEVRILLSDGSLPSDALLAEVEEYLDSDTIRPLTDHVTVLAPETVYFNIDLTYYIAKSNQNQAVSIQTEVASAIEDYKEWQTYTIGRDINPSKLTEYVVGAGAKRCEITTPEFITVPDTSVARIGTVAVTYGGVEDD